MDIYTHAVRSFNQPDIECLTCFLCGENMWNQVLPSPSSSQTAVATLHTARCTLPTAHCTLHTAHCPLPSPYTAARSPAPRNHHCALWVWASLLGISDEWDNKIMQFVFFCLAYFSQHIFQIPSGSSNGRLSYRGWVVFHCEYKLHFLYNSSANWYFFLHLDFLE